jgi:tripartite-type tricarboxylate transporter receptor subunit TctC
VVVENHPTIISIETAMKAAPDGYTVLFTAEPLWTMPYLQKVSFDPVKDFIPVALVGKAPTVLVVHPSVPVNSVSELIALAKEKPGTLNYSAGANGAASHVAGELFKSMAGIDVVRVPYNGAGPALTSVVSGVTNFTFGTAASLAFVKSGRLKGLAVTSAKPSAVFPSMPTLASTLPGYEVTSIYGVLVPAKTPSAIVDKLNREINKVLASQDVKDRFLTAGVEATAGTPQQFADDMQAEIVKIKRVIEAAGIKLE